MIKLYFKQAWQLLKQNRLFSTIYIVGTGLAIAMTMIIAIVYYIKIAPIYPEVNRPLTMVIESVSVLTMPEKRSMSSSYSSYKTLKEWYYPLKEAEVVSAVFDNFGEEYNVQPSDGGEEIPACVLSTDPAFFRLNEFSFIEGKPFTDVDFESGIRSAVLTESMARRIFGTGKAVGCSFSLNYDEYRVAGVVKDVSYLTGKTFAQVYQPYTCIEGYDENFGNSGVLGSYIVSFKARSMAGLDSIRMAVGELVRKYNLSQKEYFVDVYNQPDIHWKSIFRTGNKEVDWIEVLRLYGGILFALLLVPALNLSGMISSRMNGRLSEMGVRKAFGANRRTLLRQVVGENLILTCLGGAGGLILAWLGMVVFRNWLFSLFSSWPEAVPDGVEVVVSAEMMFSPLIFLLAFGICIVLNLLSALIPAWRALRKNIVYSLNEKK